MPLKWKRGSNPYVDNAFNVLELGPAAGRQQVLAKAKDQMQMVRAGHASSAGLNLTEHAIGDAQRRLFDARTRAEEQLLVHPQVWQEATRVKSLVKRIRESATLITSPALPPLRHRLSIFWFTPLPEPDAAQPPPWRALGIVAAGEGEDGAADLVFDG
jgi:hypothetical protein